MSSAALFAARRYTNAVQITAPQALSALSTTRVQLVASGRAFPAEMSTRLDFEEGSVLFNWGNVQAAMPLIERSAPLLFESAASPGSRRVFAGAYGWALMYSGRHETADRWLREGLRAGIDAGQGMHPYITPANESVARNLAMQGRFEEALSVLDTAPKTMPISGEGTNTPDRYNLWLALTRSRIELERGAVDRALRDFPLELLSSDAQGDLYWASFVLGHALCASGRFREGLKYLRLGISDLMAKGGRIAYEHDPDLAYYRSVAGLCSLRLGDRRSAVDWANQARAAFTAQPNVSPYFKEPLQRLEQQLRSKAS